jgi:hypothetical protein
MHWFVRELRTLGETKETLRVIREGRALNLKVTIREDATSS